MWKIHSEKIAATLMLANKESIAWAEYSVAFEEKSKFLENL